MEEDWWKGRWVGTRVGERVRGKKGGREGVGYRNKGKGVLLSIIQFQTVFFPTPPAKTSKSRQTSDIIRYAELYILSLSSRWELKLAE